MSRRLTVACILIFAGAALRLVAIGGFNFAPIGAIALFGGLMFRRSWLAFGIPLLATLLGDIGLAIQNNNDFGTYLLSPTMLFVYAGWILYVVCGLGVRKLWNRQQSTGSKCVTAVGGSVLGSVLFFGCTNFGIWATTDWYEKTAVGLSACFSAAIPFFRSTVVSDLVYFAVIVTVMSLVSIPVVDSRKSSVLATID